MLCCSGWSTGVLWKPVYNLLEGLGITLLVANAHHIKSVPGWETDMKDAEWITLPSFLGRTSHICSIIGVQPILLSFRLINLLDASKLLGVHSLGSSAKALRFCILRLPGDTSGEIYRLMGDSLDSELHP